MLNLCPRSVYQQWCWESRLPSLEITLADETPGVTFSLIEADSIFPGEAEPQWQEQLPSVCLFCAEILVEGDFWFAERVGKEQHPSLLV